MGANLCCMSLSTSDCDESKGAIGHEQRPPSRSMPNCIRPCYMKKEEDEKKQKKKRDHDKWLPPEKKAMKVCKLATLEEWLMSSPGMKPADCISGGELHVLKQMSKNRVHPSSSRVHAGFTPSPRDSITPLERIDEGDHHRGGEESLEVGSQSGKKGRRVRFRWPEADTIIFYSPEGTYELSDHEELSP